MADARSAAALLVEAIPQVMCQIKRQLAEGGHELTIAQFRVLMMAARTPGLSLGDLADANGVSPPAMSKLVDGLVDARYLERKASTDDRRRVELTLTPAGRRKLATVSDQLKEQVAERLASLSATDLAALERALTHVNDLLTPMVTA